MWKLKIENKLFSRSIFSNLRTFLSIILIIGIGVGFFVSLKTILYQYETTTEQYFKSQKFADYTIKGSNFVSNDVSEIGKLSNVEAALGRVSIDGKRDGTTLRVISLPQEDITVNIPYLFEGSLPRDNHEALISRKYANEHALDIGDKIKVLIENTTAEFSITGITASPEYVYLAQSTSMPMADPNDFGIMFVNESFFFSEGEPFYNELVIKFSENVKEEEVIKDIHQKVVDRQVVSTTKKENHIGYTMYKDDLDQINTFAYIFPIVFLFISATMIYVLQKRNVVKERKQIGILKALGYSDLKIIFSYIKYAILLSLFGSLIGFLIAYLIGDYILNVFNYMFEVPNLSLKIIPHLCLLSFFIALFVCTFSSIISVIQVIKISPAEAMHSEKPKSGKRTLLERFPSIWQRLSFNTRYSLKTAVRNKGRFFTVITGMAATITLTLLSLGLGDSFSYLIDNHYNNVVKYDFIAETIPTPLENDIIQQKDEISAYDKVLIVPVEIMSEKAEQQVPMLVVENDFTRINLKNNKGTKITVGDGVVITSNFAEKLDVDVGEYISIETMDGANYDVEIKDISVQGAGFYVYTTYDYLNTVAETDINFYNRIMIKAKDHTQFNDEELLNQHNMINIESVDHEKQTLLKLMKVIDVFIIALVSFAIILGVTVLYSVSTINLAARNYEFIVLNVMGYNTKDILIAYIKETVLQLVLAIPLGISGAYFILNSIKAEFSNDAFMLQPFIHPSSFLYTAFIMLSVIFVTKLLAKRHIDKLNIVEGLKMREE